MSQENNVDSAVEKAEVLEALRAPELAGGDYDAFAHKFWSTQPVPKFSEAVEEVKAGPIDAAKRVDEVRQEPYPLPASFEWVSCDVSSDTELQEIYTLLNANYVEDDDSLFRFDYSAEFLRWALTPPGYHKAWHIGIRANNKLVAFISAIPSEMQVHSSHMKMAEVNFLCVHKKLRSKRLAPVLIKEITRRVNLCDIWQAAYTAGVFIPRPIATCRYYHRSLNVKKLVEIGFSRLAPRMTLARTMKLFRVPETPLIKGFREMTEADIPQVHRLISEKLKSYKVAPVFVSEDEVRHWLLPRKHVVYTYVVASPSTGEVTDFASFYSLPSSVLGNARHKTMFAAYQFWHSANTCSMVELTNDLLSMAHQEGFDVFNALDLMDNAEIFEPLKFGIGDGLLQYYLYNWAMTPIKPNEVGLILL
jgi:glycylpeptide N-tetradecanoyltransferase